jgi:hypothetical protein
MRRWRLCDARAAEYLAVARSSSIKAAQYTAQSRHHEAGFLREVAHNYAREGRRYRRALLIPWEFWTLGDYTQ